MLILFCLTLLLSPIETAFSGSMERVHAEGSEVAMEITDVEELNDISNDLDGNYRLVADIDLSSEAEWELIGTEDQPFNEEFNGNGFKITWMDELFSDNKYKGLFGSVADEVDLQAIVVEFSVDNEEIGEKEVIEDSEGLVIFESEEDEGRETLFSLQVCH